MRLVFTLIWVAILVLALAAMWWGWRARTRRDAGVLGATEAPVGEVLAEFGGSRGGVQYVSTNPVGEPLTRIAAPGLRYRGPVEIVVHSDGVTVEVTGEHAVYLPATRIGAGGSASRRVGKAVEPGGLALLRWRDGTRDLESSFRFADRAEHERFIRSVDQISSYTTSQEDAK